MNHDSDELLDAVREETLPALNARTEEEFLRQIDIGIKAKRQQRAVGLAVLFCALSVWGYHIFSEPGPSFDEGTALAVAPTAILNADEPDTGDRNADYFESAHDFWLAAREDSELDSDIFGPEDVETEFELLADVPSHLGAIAELCLFN